jgi:hypothetical protein
MSYADRVRRTTITLGIVAILVGLIGFYLARDLAFDSGKGAETLFPGYELRGMTYNRLSALLVLAFGLVGLGAGLARRIVFAAAAAIGFVIMAVQVLVQWRDGVDNVLAATGANLAFSLTMAFGFGAVALFSRLGSRLDDV